MIVLWVLLSLFLAIYVIGYCMSVVILAHGVDIKFNWGWLVLALFWPIMAYQYVRGNWK